MSWMHVCPPHHTAEDGRVATSIISICLGNVHNIPLASIAAASQSLRWLLRIFIHRANMVDNKE